MTKKTTAKERPPEWDGLTLASGKRSQSLEQIEPSEKPRPRPEGDLADRLKAMMPKTETAPVERPQVTTEGVVGAAMDVLKMATPRGFDEYQRERYEKHRAAFSEEKPGPKSRTREEKADRIREWASGLTPEQRERVPTMDWYIDLSAGAKEIVDDALGLGEPEEIEAPTEEEAAALEDELESGWDDVWGDEAA